MSEVEPVPVMEKIPSAEARRRRGARLRRVLVKCIFAAVGWCGVCWLLGGMGLICEGLEMNCDVVCLIP